MSYYHQEPAAVKLECSEHRLGGFMSDEIAHFNLNFGLFVWSAPLTIGMRDAGMNIPLVILILCLEICFAKVLPILNCSVVNLVVLLSIIRDPW